MKRRGDFGLRHGQCLYFEQQVELLHIDPRKRTLLQFHDTLARNCPNLAHLTVNFYPCIPEGETPTLSDADYTVQTHHYSQGPFSLENLTRLHLSLTPYFYSNSNFRVNQQYMVVTHLIRDLTRLRALSLGIGAGNHRDWFGKCLHVQSVNLRELDVVGMGKYDWVSCDCPHLVQYRCLGQLGSGCVAGLATDTEVEVMEERYLDRSTGTLEVPASVARPIALNVPGDCWFICQEYMRPFPGTAEQERAVCNGSSDVIML